MMNGMIILKIVVKIFSKAKKKNLFQKIFFFKVVSLVTSKTELNYNNCMWGYNKLRTLAVTSNKLHDVYNFFHANYGRKRIKHVGLQLSKKLLSLTIAAAIIATTTESVLKLILIFS